MGHDGGPRTIVERDGAVVLRDERTGRQTRVTGRAAVMLRWQARHLAEIEAWACRRCGALIGSLHWHPRADAPSHYVCPSGHVSLVAAHHPAAGELLN